MSLFSSSAARLTSNTLKRQLRNYSSKVDSIKRVGVIGAGQMGLGIAYVTANVTRLPVVLMDVNSTQTEKGLQFMNKLLEKDVAKNKITEEHAKITRELVSTTDKLSGLSDVDFVIEAASENLTIKTAIFRELDKVYCCSH
ncbi:Putative 3-hydroxybutyryl-CoA dehydrogenase [Rhizopus microsporus]|nr:Putative 3-hydroxybutyryl-CoA dehydrogenase [Rhizopus microsporus]